MVLDCLGTALVELLCGEMDFNASSFVVDFEVEFTLALVNVNGSFPGGGALREAMDSNKFFPVMSTLRIVFAEFEILRHMLDFRSSMSCLGFG